MKRIKVAYWNAESEALTINQCQLQEAGMDVDVNKIQDAVEELVRK